MLKCYIEGKNNNAEYNIADGAVFTENYNETLDSGTIIIPQLNEKIDIEPYDVVVITGDNINSKRLCVDTYTCTQVSLNPAIYNYQISLFSETKCLEGILLPSLAITKLIGTSPRSVWYYLWKYLDLYCPKTDSSETSGAYGNKWSLGHNINDVNDTILLKFANIVCPEMQRNQPTFREVFNDLMMVADCIPVLQNNVINFINISEIGDEITDTQKLGVNYITESQSSEDYVSELKMNLVNSANNQRVNNNLATNIVERIGFRNNESYLLTTENMLLQTSFPIWRLFYCKCIFPVEIDFYIQEAGEQTTRLITLYNTEHGVILKDDSVDYIPEHGEWLTKDVYYGAWSVGGQNLDSRYRNTCLYYIRGQRSIHNFNEKVDYQFLFIQNTEYVFELIAKKMRDSTDMTELEAEGHQMMVDWMIEYNSQGHSATVTSGPEVYIPVNFKNAEFEVSYEPMSECVFMASKSPLQNHIRQVVDNQTNSYIDVERQGLLEYMKANRLGNKMAQINARYETSENTLPSLSQTINDKIIFQKQISVYNNHIDVNYLATENYVLRDYFTGVKAKLRSWKILSGNEALVKAENIKFYINNTMSSIRNDNRVIPVYSTLADYLNNFKYCAVQFKTNYGNRPINTIYGSETYNTNGVWVEFTKYIVGNSVIFTIQMSDNKYCGNYVSNYNGTDSRIEQKGIDYTDLNGEVITMEICFYNDVVTGIYEKENQGAIYENEIVERALKPLTYMSYLSTDNPQNKYQFTYNNLVCRIPVTINKDNKEIPQISIQFEMNEDANDMFLGKK